MFHICCILTVVLKKFYLSKTPRFSFTGNVSKLSIFHYFFLASLQTVHSNGSGRGGTTLTLCSAQLEKPQFGSALSLLGGVLTIKTFILNFTSWLGLPHKTDL